MELLFNETHRAIYRVVQKSGASAYFVYIFLTPWSNLIILAYVSSSLC